MCISEEFTSLNIATKLWSIPRAEQYLLFLSSGSNAPIVPFIHGTTCLNGCSKGKKNSLNFVLNSDDREDDLTGRNLQNCLLKISILDYSHSFDCTFLCYPTNRYAYLVFNIETFLLGYEGNYNDTQSMVTQRSLQQIAFGRIASPAARSIPEDIATAKLPRSNHKSTAKRIPPGQLNQ